jgi:hypothetical protein
MRLRIYHLDGNAFAHIIDCHAEPTARSWSAHGNTPMTAAIRQTFSGLAATLVALAGTRRRDLLADAWRESHRTVEDSIRFIRQHLRIIEAANERLPTGQPVHSPAYVEQCRSLLAWRLSLYREALRRVGECETEMAALGIGVPRSSDHWEAG